MEPTTSPAAAPLVATADPALRDELLRLAAAAGVVPDVVADPSSVLAAWPRASLVLVGLDLAADLVVLGPTRRSGVHLVAAQAVPHDAFRTALALGAEDVVELPRSATWVVEAFSDVGEQHAADALVVGVVGGSGGAGATTLACALGQAAATRGEAMVIDCDPWGPGADRVLGLEARDGFRWDALCQTTGRLSARSLREALPRRGSLGVLSWDIGTDASLQAFAVREALSAARRGHDTVVLDLPRTGEPVIGELVARCDALLVVVAPSIVGLASAARACRRWSLLTAAQVVVRGAGLADADVARATRAPVLASVPHQRGLAESIDLGLGPVRSWRGPLGRSCLDLLDRLGDQRPPGSRAA